VLTKWTNVNFVNNRELEKLRYRGKVQKDQVSTLYVIYCTVLRSNPLSFLHYERETRAQKARHDGRTDPHRPCSPHWRAEGKDHRRTPRWTLKALIFPEGNRNDFDELPANLKEGLEVHFAKEHKDVYKVAFGKG
jgi:hypothetical protein